MDKHEVSSEMRKATEEHLDRMVKVDAVLREKRAGPEDGGTGVGAKEGSATKTPGPAQLLDDSRDPLRQRQHRIDQVHKLARMFGHNSQPGSGNWLTDVGNRLLELEYMFEKRPVQIVEELSQELKIVRSQRNHLADEVRRISELYREVQEANRVLQMERAAANQRLRELQDTRQAQAQCDQSTIEALWVDINDAKVALNRHHKS